MKKKEVIELINKLYDEKFVNEELRNKVEMEKEILIADLNGDKDKAEKLMDDYVKKFGG